MTLYPYEKNETMLYSKSEMTANSTKMKAGSKLDKFQNFQKRGGDGKSKKVEKNFRRVTHQKSIRKIPSNTPFSRYLSRLTPFLARNSSRLPVPSVPSVPSVTSVTSLRDGRRDGRRDARRNARRDGLHPLHLSDVKHSSGVKADVGKPPLVHRKNIYHPLHSLHPAHPLHSAHSVHSVHSVHSKNVMNVMNAQHLKDVKDAQHSKNVMNVPHSAHSKNVMNVRDAQGGKGARRIENVVSRNSSLNPEAILKRRKAGIVSITATGNNTLLTLSDGKGRLRGSVSAGSVGFRNSAKSGLAGAEKAAARLIQKAREAGFLLLRVEMRGISFTKLKALRFMVHTPLPILDIVEKTTPSHNGCRLPRKRRL
jgi:small subunit ribosomal protein S11